MYLYIETKWRVSCYCLSGLDEDSSDEDDDEDDDDDWD